MKVGSTEDLYVINSTSLAKNMLMKHALLMCGINSEITDIYFSSLDSAEGFIKKFLNIYFSLLSNIELDDFFNYFQFQDASYAFKSLHESNSLNDMKNLKDFLGISQKYINIINNAQNIDYSDNVYYNSYFGSEDQLFAEFFELSSGIENKIKIGKISEIGEISFYFTESSSIHLDRVTYINLIEPIKVKVRFKSELPDRDISVYGYDNALCESIKSQLLSEEVNIEVEIAYRDQRSIRVEKVKVLCYN